MDLHPRAKELRKRLTAAEAKLWNALRNPAIGCNFRRQVPLGIYIADFVCFERSLIVEVDGGQHADNPSDAERDAWMEAQGYRVLRFWNHEVLGELEGVYATLLEALHERTPRFMPPTPSVAATGAAARRRTPAPAP